MKIQKVTTDLLDEMAVLSLLIKELPYPFNTIIRPQITIIDNLLIELNSIIETEKNHQIQKYGTDLLNLLESEMFEETTTETKNVVRENFFGTTIETETYNNKNAENG